MDVARVGFEMTYQVPGRCCCNHATKASIAGTALLHICAWRPFFDIQNLRDGRFMWILLMVQNKTL